MFLAALVAPGFALQPRATLMGVLLSLSIWCAGAPRVATAVLLGATAGALAGLRLGDLLVAGQ